MRLFAFQCRAADAGIKHTGIAPPLGFDAPMVGEWGCRHGVSLAPPFSPSHFIRLILSHRGLCASGLLAIPLASVLGRRGVVELINVGLIKVPIPER